jgi:5-methylcytosine-specific restriction endonuclease McrA
MARVVPCLECGRPTSPGPRCPEHTRPKQRPRDRTRRAAGWYEASYRRLRAQVLAEETTCWLCGDPPTGDDDPLVCDHVTPLSQGGTNVRENLHAAHKSCNGTRGGKLPIALLLDV